MSSLEATARETASSPSWYGPQHLKAETCMRDAFHGGALEFIYAHLDGNPQVTVARLTDSSALPAADDVGDILRHPLLRPQALRVVTDGVTQAPERFARRANFNSKVVRDSLDSRAIRSAFGAGSTLVIEDVGRWHPPVASICNTIFNERWLYANAGYFMTSSAHCGFPFHADEETTYVFQLSGRKRWQVADHAASRLGGTEVGPEDRVVEFTLEPGDAACIPPMYPHRAETIDGSDSLHLTIGVRSFKIKDLLSDLVERGISRIPSLEREIESVESIADTLVAAVQQAPEATWQRELATASIRIASGMADRGFEFIGSCGNRRDEPVLGDLVWHVRLRQGSLVFVSGVFSVLDDNSLNALTDAVATRDASGSTWRDLAAGNGLPSSVTKILHAAGWLSHAEVEPS